MNEDLDVLARTIYGEARGEDIAGKVAVANVVMNRVKTFRSLIASGVRKLTFGNGSITSACLYKYQFSCWNEKDPNREKILAVKGSDLYFAECIVVAKVAMAGLLVDNTAGSTHYHVISMGFPPSWLHPGEGPPKPAVLIGKHAFYNTVK